MHDAKPMLFCTTDFATVTSSVWTCQPNEKSLESWSRRTNHFDDEVMMDLMRFGTAVCQVHFLMDQAMEGTMQNRRCFCNPDFVTVKSSAWTDIPIQRAHLEFLISNEKAFRWWSHDGLDEKFGQPRAKSFLQGSSYGNARCKTDAVLQLWFCNCHVVRMDVQIQWTQSWVFISKKNISMTKSWWTWWEVTLPGLTYQSNEHILSFDLGRKRAFRWWSHDRLDERFGQPCAKPFLHWSSYGSAHCNTDADFATLILQLSRCQFGRANLMKQCLCLDV